MLSTSELADEIENSYSSNFVEDIILSEADRKLIVSALRRYAQPAPSSPVTETLRPCPFCGGTEISVWTGFGTQAEIMCEDCCCERAVQVVDLFESDERPKFDEKTCRYPDDAIERVNYHLIREWNTRAGVAQTPRPSAFLAWAVDMFGPVAELRSERLLRFVEEAIELAHADGMEREVFNRVTNRVYSRPAGDVPKEIGQAQACLEMFAENIGLSSADEAQREWERVQGIPRTEWERRHAAKAAVGITAPSTLCSDCPPVGYETDRTRCLPCPRRVSDTSTVGK